MRRLLLAVDGSRASQNAARHVAVAFKTSGPFELHVLNVQAPLRLHVAQFVPRPERQAFYRDRARDALRPARSLLDAAAVAYQVHAEVGAKAPTIARTASRLRCDEIVVGTTRKNALTRLVENSVAADVIERSGVPVLVVAAGDASKAERYGVPAGVGAALALLLYAAID